jgi:hypothetical protein
MKNRRIVHILKVAGFGVAALGVFGFVVESLWNWLMPDLFGARPVTYWQALGLWILGRILFGGFHGHHHDKRWRARLIERWEQMTPEEREKLRATLRHRWGSREEPEKSA